MRFSSSHSLWANCTSGKVQTEVCDKTSSDASIFSFTGVETNQIILSFSPVSEEVLACWVLLKKSNVFQFPVTSYFYSVTFQRQVFYFQNNQVASSSTAVTFNLSPAWGSAFFKYWNMSWLPLLVTLLMSSCWIRGCRGDIPGYPPVSQ